MKVVHCKKEPYDVYIGRPTKWGNPFTHIKDQHTLAKFLVSSREEAISSYKEWITKGEGMFLLNDLHELKGKTLACWCSPKPCHGDILLQLANETLTHNMELEEFKSPELTPEEKAFEAGYHAGFNTLAKAIEDNRDLNLYYFIAHHGYNAFIEAMAKYFNKAD